MKGYFRKRGDKWSFTVDIGRDPATGKRKQKSRTGFKTKKEAQNACAELITKLSTGAYADPGKKTVEGLMNEWLANRKVKVKDTTFKNYRRAAESRVIPVLGRLPMKELTHAVGQGFVNDLIEQGLSNRYIEYIVSTLHSALKFAVRTKQISSDPLEYVEVPRPRRRTHTTWTIDEVKRFLHFSSLDNPIYHMAFQLFIHTGMRRGEVLALTWDNVNLEERKISVAQSLIYDDEGFRFTTLKTNSSYRQISIDEDLAAELKRFKVKQNAFKLMLGPEYNDLGLVCCRENGNPIYFRTLAICFDRIIKKASVPKIRLHDIRHTHATILLRLGENPKIVSERLGHSRVGMTLDTYSHVTPDMQKSTADKFGSALKENKLYPL
jgi:integrase